MFSEQYNFNFLLARAIESWINTAISALKEGELINSAETQPISHLPVLSKYCRSRCYRKRLHKIIIIKEIEDDCSLSRTFTT